MNETFHIAVKRIVMSISYFGRDYYGNDHDTKNSS